MRTASSRETSLITNTIFSLLSWFLPIIIGFVATPLIVGKLGNRDYGLYAILLGFISYSFTFGIGRVLTKYIAEFRASGENERIGEVVSATFWFSLAIALVGVSLVAIAAKLIVADVLSLPPDQTRIGEIGLYLACAAIIATMLSQIFQFILQGLHRFRNFLILTNIAGVLLNAGNIVLAISGFGIVALLTWNFIAIFIMAGAFGLDALRHLPEFSLRLNLRSKEWPAVLRYGSNIILYQLFGNVLLAFERGWIVRKFGPESATFYIIPMTLAIYLHGIISSSILVIFPLVNELLTERERLIGLYEKATKMMIALIFFLSVILIFGGKALLYVWISPEMAEKSYPILVVHTLTFALIASMMIVWQLAEGFRRPVFNSIATFVSMAVAIPLMIVSAERWNIAGIAASRLIGVVVTLPLLFIIEKFCLGSTRSRFWVGILWKIGIASAVTAAGLTGYFYLFEPKYVIVFIGFALAGILFLLALAATGFFTTDERDMIWKIVFKR